jgi:hypothetical protein
MAKILGMQRKCFLIVIVLQFALFGGCVTVEEDGATNASGNHGTTTPPLPSLSVALVATDLGLADGEYVRRAHEAFAELDLKERIEYTLVGELPKPRRIEGGLDEIAMPVPGGIEPGEMTLNEAASLLSDIPETDWLVVASPYFANRVLADVVDGNLTPGAVLVLDEMGRTHLPAEPPVPVYVLSYELEEVGFVSGVAAATSSINGFFVAMGQEDDPRVDEFLDAVWAGAKYHTNSAQVVTATLPADQETGLVDPADFHEMHRRIAERMGEYFRPNHFILALGRVTPTVAYAMTQRPWNGYVVCGYADYREVRPPRILGCAVKRPDRALEYIFETMGNGGLSSLAADDGTITVGIAQEAVEFTDFELYGRSNPDADDIESVVEDIWAEIATGELELEQFIAEVNRMVEDSGDSSEEEEVTAE